MKGNISPMTLGTVQLGMNYGIANVGGKPSEEKSFAILRAALEGGVNSLDTARAYGDSEEVIGRFLRQYEGKKPRITTKIPGYKGEGAEGLEAHAVTSVEKSLENLGVSSVSAVMLHAAGDLFTYGKSVVSVLESLIKRGYTEKVGVSIYTSREIEEMLKYDSLTVTQIPMSIFDQRLLSSGSLELLEKRGAQVYVRSVFLQGLFFLDPKTLTDPILRKEAVPYLHALREIAEREGVSVAGLATGFLRDLPGVTSLVLGADAPEHVEQDLSYFSTPPLSERTMAELKEKFSRVDVPEIMKVLSRPRR